MRSENGSNGGASDPILLKSLNPEYVLQHTSDRVVFRNFEGKIFEYPETADGSPVVRPLEEIAEPELV